MPPPPDGKQIRLHRFTVPCALHGTHVFYLSGLDHAVDDAAFYLLRTLRRNGHQPEYEHAEYDLFTLDALMFPPKGDLDDLPY